MKKLWKDVTNTFSETRRHYNGKYLLKSHVYNNEIEVQLYKVLDDGFDYLYEIFFS